MSELRPGEESVREPAAERLGVGASHADSIGRRVSWPHPVRPSPSTKKRWGAPLRRDLDAYVRGPRDHQTHTSYASVEELNKAVKGKRAKNSMAK